MPRSTATTHDLFQRILKRGANQNIYPMKTKRSREWFRNQAMQLRTMGKTLIKHMGNEPSRADRVLPGEMYVFEYDAKLKDVLPYWDRFPVIFCLNLYGGRKSGMLGINLHYLPPPARAKLMDALYSLLTTTNGRVKLQLSYWILKEASKYRAFRPCIKRYLSTHIKSSILRVEPEEWDIALFLPNVAKWQKASQEQVWRESMKMIR